jgi:hypothetical protein
MKINLEDQSERLIGSYLNIKYRLKSKRSFGWNTKS